MGRWDVVDVYLENRQLHAGAGIIISSPAGRDRPDLGPGWWNSRKLGSLWPNLGIVHFIHELSTAKLRR